jgi:hypothetical protein
VEATFDMSMPYNYELVKDGVVVHTHAWRSWMDPNGVREYKDRCFADLNYWHETQGSAIGGTLNAGKTVPMIPEFDTIRFEWPPGTIVNVPVKTKTSL